MAHDGGMLSTSRDMTWLQVLVSEVAVAVLMSVYLDYNATSPLAPEALEAITTALRDAWANPNSSHLAGRRAHQCIEEARGCVGRMINAMAEDVVFTSGGTESNNMVFDSVIRYWNDLSREGGVASEGKPHIIISNLEHDSVVLCVRRLEKEGRVEVSEVPADTSTGAVTVRDVMSAVRPSTLLISLILAQNETGVLQPVGEVVEAVRQLERDTGRRERLLVHTDAAQALGKVSVDVQALGVDYLTVVGHKFYGPRIGALYCRGLGGNLRNSSGPRGQGAPLYAMLAGGGQERGLRPGTQNTGMIAGLGKASELVADNIDHYHSHMKTVRDYLEQRLLEVFGEEVRINGRYPNSDRLPNTCNFSLLEGVLTGQRVLGALECSQASVGAACHSHFQARPSPALLASGVPEQVAVNALRVSVGRETSTQDVDTFIADLIRARDKLTPP